VAACWGRTELHAANAGINTTNHHTTTSSKPSPSIAINYFGLIELIELNNIIIMAPRSDD
jgi:hypothetical protein